MKGIAPFLLWFSVLYETERHLSEGVSYFNAFGRRALLVLMRFVDAPTGTRMSLLPVSMHPVGESSGLDVPVARGPVPALAIVKMPS